LIKAILFDLDGTLINTNNLIVKTFQFVLKERLKLDVKREELVKYFGEPLRDTMNRYYPQNPDLLVQAYKEHNVKIHDKLAEKFEGVEEGLFQLKELGYKIAVVTSKKRITAERGLKLFNLYDIMDAIVTPEDTQKHKPNPEPVLKACDLLKVNSEEAIMVGDSHNDILSGKNAKCLTCLVKYTAVPLNGLLKHNPDYVIDSITDIPHIIKELEKEAI
jgi:pyrophosphatase PpaX